MNGDRWERAYLRLLRVVIQTLAALLGLYIMYRAVQQGTDKPWLYMAALMMMGLPGARTFESLVRTAGKLIDSLKTETKEKSHNGDSAD